MKVLVIGSGGREHALVWKISQSPRVERIYCAPGNGGIGRIAELVPVGPEEIEKIADFAARERIDLTVVGPELPLTLGISDLFEKRALKIFGPNREAARLGGSRPSPKITKKAFIWFSEHPQEAKRYAGKHVAIVDEGGGGRSPDHMRGAFLPQPVFYLKITNPPKVIFVVSDNS